MKKNVKNAACDQFEMASNSKLHATTTLDDLEKLDAENQSDEHDNNDIIMTQALKKEESSIQVTTQLQRSAPEVTHNYLHAEMKPPIKNS